MSDEPTRPQPRIVVTRSLDDGAGLVGRFTDLGLDVVVHPLIEVVGPSDGGDALRRALGALGRFGWVVLTSANAVRAVADARGRRTWPEGVAVAVVGPATAATARRAGLPVDLVPEVATAAALVEAFPEAPPVTAGLSREVLAPLAELASPTVEVGLGAKGWSVERVEAYRTVEPIAAGAPTPDPIGPGAEVVTFFSPSAVDRWVSHRGRASGTAVCIGPSTAARARERGFEAVVMAEPHTEDGVVAAVEALIDR